MYEIKDFAILFSCSARTIHRYIYDLKMILKGFDLKKRKRQYTPEEAQIILDHIKAKLPKGKKRDNGQNKKLADISI